MREAKKKHLKTLGPNAASDEGDDHAPCGGDCTRVDNPGAPRRPAPPRVKFFGATSAAAKRRGFEVVGFHTVSATSAHDMAELTAIVKRAIATAKRTWKWSPTNLVVQFHNGGKTFGFARGPGSGPRVGFTIISLSKRLLAEYDARSVGRTVVHELCHHYREESFAATIHLRKLKGHDDIFCRELKRADPLSADPITCRYFTEERVKPTFDRRVRWVTSAGHLRMARKRGRGQMMFWEPNKPGAWTAPEFLFTDGELADLASRFPRKSIATMKILGTHFTLGGIVQWCLKRPAKFPVMVSKFGHKPAGAPKKPAAKSAPKKPAKQAVKKGKKPPKRRVRKRS